MFNVDHWNQVRVSHVYIGGSVVTFYPTLGVQCGIKWYVTCHHLAWLLPQSKAHQYFALIEGPPPWHREGAGIMKPRVWFFVTVTLKKKVLLGNIWIFQWLCMYRVNVGLTVSSSLNVCASNRVCRVGWNVTLPVQIALCTCSHSQKLTFSHPIEPPSPQRWKSWSWESYSLFPVTNKW